MTKYECTQKVLKRIAIGSKDEVAKEIGITRPTLDARLKWHSWKISELTHIKTL